MLLQIHTFTKCWSVTVTSLRRSWGTSRVLLSLCMWIQVSSLIYQGLLSSLSLHTKVETELSCLQGQGMSEPVSFSDWAAPIVPVVKRDGIIRICGDYKLTVNAVAKTDSYHLPRIEDIFASLSSGKPSPS